MKIEHQNALRAAAKQALDLLERVPSSANDTIPIEKVREDLRRALADSEEGQS